MTLDERMRRARLQVFWDGRNEALRLQAMALVQKQIDRIRLDRLRRLTKGSKR